MRKIWIVLERDAALECVGRGMGASDPSHGAVGSNGFRYHDIPVETPEELPGLRAEQRIVRGA